MSAQQDLSTPDQCQATGRGHRTKIPSQKVRDSLRSAVGNPSTPATPNSTITTPAKPSSSTGAPAATSVTPSQAAVKSNPKSTPNNTTTSIAQPSTPSGPTAAPSTAHPPASQSANKQPVAKKPASKKKEKPPMARPKKQGLLATLEARGAFSAAKVLIYQWPPPLPPKSFTNLSESSKRWKARQDAAEGAADIDDGADSWEEFDNDPDLYGGEDDLKYAVASAFVKRAKRAYRAGKQWNEFEASELSFDIQQVISATSDEMQRRMMMDNPLDNGLRLDVFDHIKERLCNEIWSNNYVQTRRRLTPSGQRRDSKLALLSQLPPAEKSQELPEEERTVSHFEQREPGSHVVRGVTRFNAVWKEDQEE